MNVIMSGSNLNVAGLPRTVILRNLPNNCTRSKLLDQVSESGFAGLFDSFHMPMDQDTGANKGYAFFNFNNYSTAEIFRSVFHGKRLPGFKSKKVLVVEIARVQTVAQEKNPPVNNEQRRVHFDQSTVPAKISISTLSAILLHQQNLKARSNLIPSHPAKVSISEVAPDSFRQMFSDGEQDDEGRTPSISDVDSISDDEMKALNKSQSQAEMPFFLYRISF
jgi:RNA recognition motif-containing protein